MMVPLNLDSADLGPVARETSDWRRTLALEHALGFRRDGIWGDAPTDPRSVVWLREGDGQWEAFGAGECEPAVGWLARRAGIGTVALLAPEAWERAVGAAIRDVERTSVLTWIGGSRAVRSRYEGFDPRPRTPALATRRLTLADERAFVEVAPAWALRGWGSFPALIEHGAAFGVPHGAGLAALAWVVERGRIFAALGVETAPRFRRLGLGRAVALALRRDILDRQARVPLWITTPGNAASQALARSLGFSPRPAETLLRWRQE